jgi:hypothetical protein
MPSPGPLPEPASSRARTARLAVAAAFAAAFALPLVALLCFKADPLTIGNESLAYRFLFSERLIRGEGSSVWVLAGFLTTAIQTTLMRVIDAVTRFPAADLFDRTHWYAYTFTSLVVLSGIAVFFSAAIKRTLGMADLALLGLAALGPLYLTKTIGFYYYTLPDYYHLDILLTLGAVWLFQLAWNRPDGARPGAATFFAAGAFVGIACANKVTMAMITCTVLVPLLLRQKAAPGPLFRSAAAAALGAALGFLFVILWFYQFRLSAALGMFPRWLATIRNPGGEASFWASDFRNSLTGYSYGYIIAFYLLAILVAAGIASRTRERRSATFWVLAAALAGGAAWAYFVYKRPAGTTFFEAAVALLGFGSVALATVSRTRMGACFIGLAALFWTGFAYVTFPLQAKLEIVQESKPWADNMWRLEGELLEFSRGHDIIVVHPDNNRNYSGVPEFLLKGTADVPTWHVTENGRPVLDRYAPRMSFRHEYGGPFPSLPYPEGCVVFWIDRPEFRPLIDDYPSLRAAYLRKDAPHREWVVAIQGGRAVIKAHAVKLVSAALPRALEPGNR